MATVQNKRNRPKLKLLVKYKIYLSIRLSNNKKLVKHKKANFGSSIKRKIMYSTKQKISGWQYLKVKLAHNNIFILSKNSLSINKKYKMLLFSKQKFKNSFFLSNNFIKSMFKHNQKTSLQNLNCRIDFLLFRIFAFPTLFYVRKLILHRFVKLKCINKYVVKLNYIIQNGNFVIITKQLFYPKVKSYNEKIATFNNFYSASTFLLFGIDVNYKTQSFILNLDFINYFEIFSIFHGFLFSKNIIKNFYNR